MAAQVNPYARAFRKAGRVLVRVLESPWAPISPDEVERTCDWLQGLRSQEIDLWVRNAPRAQHPQVVRRLLRRASAERHAHPARSRELFQQAVQVAEALRYPAHLSRVAFDLQAEAFAHLANSFRVTDEFTRADESWERCEERRAQGTGDLQLRGEVLARRGVLRKAQRRFPEALGLIGEGATFLERIHEPHRAGKARLAQAITHFDAGDPATALDTAALAGSLLDCHREPEMGFALMHNTLFFLEATKEPDLTQALFHKLEPFYWDAGSPLVITRCWWLQGRLLAAESDWRPATRHFDAVRKDFVERKLTYDAALAGFDAAHAYAQLGQPLKVKHIAEQMVEVFTSKDIPVEAAAALKLFVDAALDWEANAAFMAKVALDLEKARFPALHAPPAPRRRRR